MASFLQLSLFLDIKDDSDKERKRATTIAIAIVGRAITIWEAIQKRGHEPIYKTKQKMEAQRLRATTFAIEKLEER